MQCNLSSCERICSDEVIFYCEKCQVTMCEKCYFMALRSIQYVTLEPVHMTQCSRKKCSKIPPQKWVRCPCGLVNYCDKSCAKKNWIVHRNFCTSRGVKSNDSLPAERNDPHEISPIPRPLRFHQMCGLVIAR